MKKELNLNFRLNSVKCQSCACVCGCVCVCMALPPIGHGAGCFVIRRRGFGGKTTEFLSWEDTRLTFRGMTNGTDMFRAEQTGLICRLGQLVLMSAVSALAKEALRPNKPIQSCSWDSHNEQGDRGRVRLQSGS